MKNKLLFSLFLLAGCHQSNSDVANGVMSSYAKQAKDQDLSLAGYGGSTMGSISQFKMSFDTPNHLTLQEARKLLVKTIHDFLNYVNSNEAIRSRLAVHPMTAKNVSIMISFRKDDDWRPPREFVALFYNKDEKLFYSHWDNTAQRFCDKHQETLEEAIKLSKPS